MDVSWRCGRPGTLSERTAGRFVRKTNQKDLQEDSSDSGLVVHCSTDLHGRVSRRKTFAGSSPQIPHQRFTKETSKQG